MEVARRHMVTKKKTSWLPARLFPVNTPVMATVNLGAVDRGCAETATKFIGVMSKGQTGFYLRPAPSPEDESWHVLAFGAWDILAALGQFVKVGRAWNGDQEELW